MFKLKFIVFPVICTIYSCQTDNSEEKKTVSHNIDSVGKEQYVCPCDSFGLFEENGKNLLYLYLKNYFFITSKFPNNDTIDLRRYSMKDRLLDEAIEILNYKIVNPQWAMYADFKDTINYYKLTFHNNKDLGKYERIVKNKLLGVEFLKDSDTLKSKTNYILVPKDKFNGLVRLDEIINITHKGKKRDVRQPIYIDAEMMKKYGNILGQYKAIMENCDLSIPQQAKEK